MDKSEVDRKVATAVWNEKDVDTDPSIEVDKNGLILTSIKPWLKVDDAIRVNVYGFYDPFADSLRLEYVIDCEEPLAGGEEVLPYLPTPYEARFIKGLISDKIKSVYGQTPQGFVLSNTMRIVAKRKTR